jgi:GNAT superfamily N-acetyltransferase
MLAIREIQPSDIPALFRVRAATDENRLTQEELASLGITEASVRDRLLASYKGWLCEDGGEVVGFAIGDRSTGEMWVIAVVPTHLRKGIGGALLQQVEEWMSSEGCRELWLTTDIDTGLRAYSFYRSHGWVDWKMEAGNRYMKKTWATRPDPPNPAGASRVDGQRQGRGAAEADRSAATNAP